jgi:hypothetical protein
MRLQLLFQPLEQGEGVGSRASEAADHAAVAQPPDLLRIRLDHRIAKAHLAVACDNGPAVLLHPEDGGAVILFQSSAPASCQAGCGKNRGLAQGAAARRCQHTSRRNTSA